MAEYGATVWYRGRNLVVDTSPIYFLDMITNPYNGSKAYNIPSGTVLKVMSGMTAVSSNIASAAQINGNVVSWQRADFSSPIFVYSEVP